MTKLQRISLAHEHIDDCRSVCPESCKILKTLVKRFISYTPHFDETLFLENAPSLIMVQDPEYSTSGGYNEFGNVLVAMYLKWRDIMTHEGLHMSSANRREIPANMAFNEVHEGTRIRYKGGLSYNYVFGKDTITYFEGLNEGMTTLLTLQTLGQVSSIYTFAMHCAYVLDKIIMNNQLSKNYFDPSFDNNYSKQFYKLGDKLDDIVNAELSFAIGKEKNLSRIAEQVMIAQHIILDMLRESGNVTKSNLNEIKDLFFTPKSIKKNMGLHIAYKGNIAMSTYDMEQPFYTELKKQIKPDHLKSFATEISKLERCV